MITAEKTSTNYTKTDTYNMNLSNQYTYKNDNFKNVLNSTTNAKNTDTSSVDKYNKSTSSTDEDNSSTAIDGKKDENNSSVEDKKGIKEELDDLEKDSKSSSEDKINDILTELLNLLNKLGLNNEQDINLNKTVTSSNSNDVMTKLIALLKESSKNNKIDNDTLNLAKNILSNLSNNISDENSGLKNNMKSAISEITSMLNNSKNEKISTSEQGSAKNSSQENSGKNSTTSKEDKFLNSLINDNKDTSLDKINLFASRVEFSQNQGVNAEQNLTVNKATFASDLIKDVQYMNNNGIKELSVKVNPGNLGQITINLVEENGVMKANLKADSKDVANLLTQNLADIKSHLNEKNIKIDEVNIELYQEDTTFFSNQEFNGQLEQEKQKNTNSNNTIGEVDTEENLNDISQGIYNGNVNFLA